MKEMKDSGIGWIKKIPENWNLIRNKYNFTLSKYIIGSKWCETQLLSLTKNGVKEINDGEQTGKVPASLSTYQKVTKNDIVMCLFDLDCSAVFSGRSNYNGMISPAYKCFKCNESLNPEYVDFYFRTVFVDRKYMRYSKNVRYSLASDEFLDLPILVPPIEEQKKIAAYLDEQCKKIDEIMVDIQNQINTLEDYRKSVISETVTRGLNPNVEMKKTDIGWISCVPKHWKIDKIKFHLQRLEYRNPGNMPILSVYREYGVIPKDSRSDNHNVTSEDTSKYKYVKPGYLVINKMKAWQGSMGVSDYEGVVSPAYFIYVFTDNSFSKKYVHYLLRSTYKNEFRRLSGGIREGQWDLAPEGFENTLILIPPVNEQEEIVEYIDKKRAEIDSIIVDKKAQLETIENYKKSLIYEYVTGKKEVPENE